MFRNNFMPCLRKTNANESLKYLPVKFNPDIFEEYGDLVMWSYGDLLFKFNLWSPSKACLGMTKHFHAPIY